MREAILYKRGIHHSVCDSRKEVFQVCLENVFLPLVKSGVANVFFALHSTESVIRQRNIIDQICIDTFLDIFQFGFWWINDSCPILAAVNGYILWLVFSFVSLLIRLNDSDPTVELFYIVHNTSHPFFRFAENDVAKNIGFLSIKNKRDVTSQASSE